MIFSFDLSESVLRLRNWHSEGFKKPSFPRVSRIQNAIKPKFHDVLHDHPRDVVSPYKANNFPRQWRHKPALTAHEHGGDLRRDDSEKKPQAWIRRVSKRERKSVVAGKRVDLR